jgi:hypothetical protein
MNPEVKAKWVAALRSGTYSQGQSALRVSGDSFCCLGVLCDISELGDWEDVLEREDDDDESPPKYCEGEGADFELPPPGVCDWAGFADNRFISNRVPSVLINGSRRPLHEHNDEGITFAELADAIEEQL